MFSATRLLGGLVSNGLGKAARGVLGDNMPSTGFGRGAMGVAAGAAGLAAVGGVSYMAYKHFKDKPAAGTPAATSAAQAGFGSSPAQAGFGSAAPPTPGAAPGAPPATAQPGFAGIAPGSGALLGERGALVQDPSAAGFGSGSPPTTPTATAPAPTTTSAAAATSAGDEANALLLVRAMIAAAYVDGKLDGEERQHILDGAARGGMTEAERSTLDKELSQPVSPHYILGQVTDAELARQLYACTLLAIDVDSDREHAYVRGLPLMLSMSDESVKQIHDQLGVPLPA